MGLFPTTPTQNEEVSMVWYGMVGPDQSLAIKVGPLGRVGQRLLLRVILLAPNQIILNQIRKKRQNGHPLNKFDPEGKFYYM